MSEPEKKVMFVRPAMYTAIRSFLRDHEDEYGAETAKMAFLQLGIPEQPRGTEIRVIVAPLAQDFHIEPDVGQLTHNPEKEE
jgi:hypothetical protein